MCLPQRFLVMLLICIYTLAFFFQVYSPSGLEVYFIKQMNITSGQFSTLYSVAAWSSLLDVANSIIIEKWLGLKLATHIYILIITLGNATYVFAVYYDCFWLAVVGRSIFGLGGNPMCLCMNCFILHWFEGKEVNLMFSSMVSVIWLGSSVSYFVSVPLLEYVRSFSGMNGYTSLATTTCILTGILTIAMCSSSGILSLIYKGKKSDIKEENIKPEEKKSLKYLLSFHPIFWIFSLSTFCYFISIVSYATLSQQFYKNKYNFSIEKASNLSGMFSLLIFVLSPPLGFLVDKTGRNLIFHTVGVLTSLASHVIFKFTMLNPIFPIIIMAVSGALSSISWSMFQYLVNEDQYVLAYGFAQTGVNFALALGTLVSGYFIDMGGYNLLESFYFLLTFCSMLLVIIVWVMDFRLGRIISMSAEERKQREKREVETS